MQQPNKIFVCRDERGDCACWLWFVDPWLTFGEWAPRKPTAGRVPSVLLTQRQAEQLAGQALDPGDCVPLVVSEANLDELVCAGEVQS